MSIYVVLQNQDTKFFHDDTNKPTTGLLILVNIVYTSDVQNVNEVGLQPSAIRVHKNELMWFWKQGSNYSNSVILHSRSYFRDLLGLYKSCSFFYIGLTLPPFEQSSKKLQGQYFGASLQDIGPYQKS